MSISKDVIKQCLISKQREVDEAVIVNRPVEFEENGNYVIVGVRHAGKSYLLYQHVRQLQAAGKGWDEILFVDFEDERLAEFQTEDFNSLLEAHLELYGKKPVVFLDKGLKTTPLRSRTGSLGLSKKRRRISTHAPPSNQPNASFCAKSTFLRNIYEDF